MNFLVLGRTGQLGSQLINDLNQLKHNVIAPPRQELDITNIKNDKKFNNLLKENNFDYVINCAAYNNVNDCNTNISQAFDVNCSSVKNMAEICNLLNVNFITFSTDYVFNGNKQYEYIETDTPSPVNIYGISKLCGEYASLIYNNTTVIRTCGLYGLQSNSTKGGKGNFIDNRIKDAESNNFVKVNCEQIVSPTFVNDLSEAIIKLIMCPIKKYNLYHLVNEGHCSWYELTKEIYEILDVFTEVIPVNRSGTDGNIRRPLFSALRNERAKELGICLPHWKDALRRYLKIKYPEKNVEVI